MSLKDVSVPGERSRKANKRRRDRHGVIHHVPSMMNPESARVCSFKQRGRVRFHDHIGDDCMGRQCVDGKWQGVAGVQSDGDALMAISMS
ncbi:hypothetical protein [Paraburkholderia hospita]|uniref:hypothetical protein n=1 Tax=Paraburkholderia hospita TaxID=169430 RepID=UPI00137530CF|nr:hypothetical protein [Paraburkholderia hospita]